MKEMFEMKLVSRMSLMKLVCAFLVVVIHAKFTVDSHLAVCLRNLVSEGLCRIAVPFFFFAAGYFMSRHMEEDGWWGREICKRIRSVLVPGTIFLFAYIAITYLLNWSRGVPIPSCHGYLADFGLDPRRTPLLVPVWFVRAFMIIVCASPVLWRLFGCVKRRIAIVNILLLAFLVFMVRPFSDCAHTNAYYLLNYGLSLEGVLYFSIGIFVRKHPIGIPSRRKSLGLLSCGLGLFVCKFVALHYRYPEIGFRLGFFAIPATAVGLYFLLPKIKLPVGLHNMSFPVYLIHVFVLSSIGGRYGAKMNWLTVQGGGLVLWIIRIGIALLLSILITILLDSIFPRVSKILFGGRIASMSNKGRFQDK